MNPTLKQQINATFEEAEKTFKMAEQAIDAAFAETHTTTSPSGDHTDTIQFVAPNWKHRRKLTLTFIKMAWRMARTGKATFRTKTK